VLLLLLLGEMPTCYGYGCGWLSFPASYRRLLQAMQVMQTYCSCDCGRCDQPQHPLLLRLRCRLCCAIATGCQT
jgi:hypothetical protein